MVTDNIAGGIGQVEALMGEQTVENLWGIELK